MIDEKKLNLEKVKNVLYKLCNILDESDLTNFEIITILSSFSITIAKNITDSDSKNGKEFLKLLAIETIKNYDDAIKTKVS